MFLSLSAATKAATIVFPSAVGATIIVFFLTHLQPVIADIGVLLFFLTVLMDVVSIAPIFLKEDSLSDVYFQPFLNILNIGLLK